MSRDDRIHLMHVVYSFSTGGLENVIVQLINGLPRETYRHSVLALTAIDHTFASRVSVPDVHWIELQKPPGHPYGMYPRFSRLMRQMQPDVVHTCNLAALEMMPAVAWAGVPLRVHAEHGWDVSDPVGDNRRYRLLRRIYRRFVDRYITVSDDLTDYLVKWIGVPGDRIRQIANGVDLQRFTPTPALRKKPDGFPFGEEHWVVGTVGRLAAIKNQGMLIDAFAQWLEDEPSATAHTRLAIIGDGPDRECLQERANALRLDEKVWFSGSRADIPDLLRELDCFVLPSTAEGMPCTLQEAMATGLPIVATRVGAVPALLQDGRLGQLVDAGDVASMAHALKACRDDFASWLNAGALARQYVLEKYSLPAMLGQYDEIFSQGAVRDRRSIGL